MSAIFISYRREDTEGHAGRLFEVLVERFGKESVFMDVAGIEPGLDFRKAIDSNVADCGALLAVIGKGWLTAKNEAGQRRIDDPHDFVRLETVSALKRDIPVIPVLVHGAAMPRAEQLPPDLQELAFRNGVELTHARWDSDVELLAKALERYVKKPAASEVAAASRLPADTPSAASPSKFKFIGIAGVVAAFAVGGAVLYQHNAGDSVKSPEVPVKKVDAQPPAQPPAPTAEQDKTAAAQKEAAALKAKAEQEEKDKQQAEAREAARLADEKKRAEIDQAAQAVATRESDLRTQELKIKQQAEALNAARLAAEKKAEADRLAKIELDKKLAEANKPPVPEGYPVRAPGTDAPPVKPTENPAPTSITFTNNGDRAVDVYWVNFNGKERRYFTLPPGQTFKQDTYVSHNWIVRDSASQRQLATAVGAARPGTMRIGEPRVAAGLGTDGRKVKQVTIKGGTAYYKLTSPGAWIETGPSGNDTRFSFQETGRDDWSVYLIDRSRNVTLQLDLYRRWVVYQHDKPGERRDLYEITAAN